MKNIMKKQCERFPLWRFKGFMLAALSGLAVVAFAQNVEINRGTSYLIASTVDASGASTYQWLENGQVISGATGASYIVPDTKHAGIYRYIRQAKSADCPDWQSSNEFTVSVVGPETTGALAPYIDPRDGKEYQTVNMPDGKTWFAQNLNYTKDLYYNTASDVANGKTFTSMDNGVPAIGSYWCPPMYVGTPTASGAQGACDVYGALYTWETAMMVDGKYADETKTGTAWVESWVSSNYFDTGAPGATSQADINNARGGTNIKSGGRGICPPGWHIPTDREWAQMLDAAEGNTTYTVGQTGIGWWGTVAGQKIKSRAIYTGADPGDGSWMDDANRGTNISGFGAVSSGYRHANGAQFYDRGVHVTIWSSSVGSSSGAWHRFLVYNSTQVFRNYPSRSYGLSVRCVRD
jgi:uncharacterized protein (TIGR02145 family)